MPDLNEPNMIAAQEEEAKQEIQTEQHLPPMGFDVIKREFKQNKLATFSLTIFIVILLIAFIAPMFMDLAEISRVNIFARFTPPGEDGFILGSNEGGQDILSLLVIGTRNSLIIAIAVTIITSLIGIGLGIMAGYYGGRVDDGMMRIIDFLMILPQLMIIIVITTIIQRNDIPTLITVISLMGWMGITRLFRTATLSEASKDYVAASKTMGTPDWKIMFGEVMPNLSTLIFTYLTLAFAGNIGLETGLSFLGFGLPIGTPSLGTLISSANNPDVIQNKTWIWLPAVILVLVLMLSINYIGQALQKASDTRQR